MVTFAELAELAELWSSTLMDADEDENEDK